MGFIIDDFVASAEFIVLWPNGGGGGGQDISTVTIRRSFVAKVFGPLSAYRLQANVKWHFRNKNELAFVMQTLVFKIPF